MGYRALDIRISSVDDLLLFSYPVDDSILFSLAAVDFELRNPFNSLWIEIGILSGGDVIANRAAILANGYLTTGASISWTGNIPLGSQSFVYAFAIGEVNATFRLMSLSTPIKNIIPNQT